MIKMIASGSMSLALVLSVLLALFEGQAWLQIVAIAAVSLATGASVHLLLRIWQRIRPVEPQPLCKWQLVRYGD